MNPSLGPGCLIDLQRLLETRLLIQASSGYGKSYALRRLFEQTAPHVQQLIVDPEGEFATLREKHDYIIAAPKGGDATANPKTAALLARRLLETGVSAILDIYDLRADERQRFVKLFLDALVNAPRELWRPVMVAVDEAHIFCPQNGSAEAQQAVIDVATRGRKRGQCLVLATQRLSKLHKDTAAEMLNKLIGRTQLDVDVKRASDDLGLTAREAMAQLRTLKPGQFFGYGPALTDEIRKIEIGPVHTSHPKAGDRLLKAPPAPSPAIRAQLAKLADLQKDAEQEAKTVDELRAEIARLKREQKAPAVDEEKLRTAVRAMLVSEFNAKERTTKKAFDEMQAKTSAALKHAKAICDALCVTPALPEPVPQSNVYPPNAAGLVQATRNAHLLKLFDTPARITKGPTPVQDEHGGHGLVTQSIELRSGAVRILRELAARSPAGYTKAQVGALTKFSHKGGTFNTYLSDLRRHQLIEERDGLLFASDEGISYFGDKPPAPTTHEEAMEQWSRALRSGAYKMLCAVVEAGEEGLHRANLADLVNMTAAGGTFNTYLSDLRRNGLIEERGKRLFANNILFPENT